MFYKRIEESNLQTRICSKLLNVVNLKIYSPCVMNNMKKEQFENTLGVRKRVSIVWSYFEKLSRERVRCKLCRHEQRYSGTTGNILRHLRNKHNIDATIKGQGEHEMDSVQAMLSETEEQRLVNGDSEDFPTPVKVERSTYTPTEARHRTNRTKVVYCEELDIGDIYAESTINFGEYIAANETIDSKAKEDFGNKSKSSPQEERMIAEIDYFREKAAYYRMQKNLTALQAKKLKYELDHLA